jgi:aldose 1-epimerase
VKPASPRSVVVGRAEPRHGLETASRKTIRNAKPEPDMRLPAIALLGLAMMGIRDAAAASLTTEPFGKTEQGEPVTLTRMTNAHGFVVEFMSYGGIVTKILAPDREGRLADIVLGFPTLRDYETKSAEGGLYFGALIGRYANRIAHGRFELDGHTYALAVNDPPNALHGGKKGFDKRVWDVRPIAASGPKVGAELRYTSPDGEEGYPGTLNVTVTYTLTDDDVFSIRYQATTDKDTVLNLTNHSYFNLAGAGSPDGVFAQILTVNADRYTPTDATQIPTGEIAPVAGTPLDFRKPTPIGARIRDDFPQLLFARGYDHNWVLNKGGNPAEPSFAARAADPKSGRYIECYTTQPGLQVYTSNSLTGAYAGIGGAFRQTDAFALETQHFPDSPNHPNFPTTELKPGQTFDSLTEFRFGVVHD